MSYDVRVSTGLIVNENITEKDIFNKLKSDFYLYKVEIYNAGVDFELTIPWRCDLEELQTDIVSKMINYDLADKECFVEDVENDMFYTNVYPVATESLSVGLSSDFESLANEIKETLKLIEDQKSNNNQLISAKDLDQAVNNSNTEMEANSQNSGGQR